MTATDKETEAVKSVIDHFFDALDKQDLKMMSYITAHDADMVHIGTDTEEYWVGWEQLKQDTARMFSGLQSYKADIQNLRITLAQSGDVAWFTFLLNTVVHTEQEKVQTRNGRYSGVMEKRDGHWQLVQTHLSKPESEQVVRY